MAGYYPVDRGEWLLQIGRRLLTEYDDIIAAAPVPDRLAFLLKQLEETADNTPSSSLNRYQRTLPVVAMPVPDNPRADLENLGCR